MGAKNPSSSRNLWSFVTMIYQRRILCSNSASQGYNSDLLLSKSGYSRDETQGLRFFSSRAGSFKKFEPNGVKDEASSKVQPPVPAAPEYSPFAWMKWLMGSLLSILIPLWKQNWESLPGLEGKVVKVVEEVEDVVEVVEKMATMTEKAAEVVADNLPDKCNLKQAALVVEHVSNVIVQDAEQTKNFIDKVDNLKQDIKDLETIVEPVIDKIVEMENAKN